MKENKRKKDDKKKVYKQFDKCVKKDKDKKAYKQFGKCMKQRNHEDSEN